MDLDFEGDDEGNAQTQRLGNGRRKESQPFGAAGNILTLAYGTFVMGCCALLARSHIARLLRDHVAKGPGGSAYGLAGSDTSLDCIIHRRARRGPRLRGVPWQIAVSLN
jgi:hypothetical protein